jgi:hypothetical protein
MSRQSGPSSGRCRFSGRAPFNLIFAIFNFQSSIVRLVGLGLPLFFGACATTQPHTVDPFARAVFLFYDAEKGGRRGITDALLWLDLEVRKPTAVAVRVFDERDRSLSFDPKLLSWSGSENLQIEPTGKATVKVTLLGGNAGRLQVAIGNHTGEIRVRKRGE